MVMVHTSSLLADEVCGSSLPPLILLQRCQYRIHHRLSIGAWVKGGDLNGKVEHSVRNSSSFTGRVVSPITPSSTMMIEMTEERTGRLMKLSNLMAPLALLLLLVLNGHPLFEGHHSIYHYLIALRRPSVTI